MEVALVVQLLRPHMSLGLSELQTHMYDGIYVLAYLLHQGLQVFKLPFTF